MMKLTLWIGISASREDGPASSSATPLAKIASVSMTSSGAITRSAAGGGPFRR